MNTPRPRSNSAPSAGTLGTFGGVFTPSLLTILGLVLFLRLGYVVGNVGLIGSLLILVMATSVSVLTSISLAAMATNMKVRGGGVYFLISRTLGPAFGGAIGIVLYGAMSVSVAFYAIGFGEAVASMIGEDPADWAQPIAALTVLALLGLGWLGADIATRLQYVVMVLLVLALGSYFLGIVPDIDAAQIGDNASAPVGADDFWLVFAIFFPAITGFTQGVAMSGDLRNAGRSIAVGTFAAVGLSTLVYLLVIITLAGRFDTADLRTDPNVMKNASAISWMIDAGVIAATLSSAIASILGAPRTLQRLANDKLIPRLELFGQGAGAQDNPRRATTLTACIALITIAAGDLNVVAPIISMFFLVSYGLINYATFYEARAASTSFRPRFRLFDARLSLLGTIVCAGVIVAIDPLAGLVAGLLLAAIFAGLQRTARAARWSDSSRAHYATEARRHLRAAAAQPSDGRDWRPCSLVFVPRDATRRTRLIIMAEWLEGGVGYTTAIRMVEGSGARVRQHAAMIERELQREISTRHPGVFGRVVAAPDLGSATAAAVQMHGFGDLRTNLAVHGWADLEARLALDGAPQREALLQSTRLGANVVIAACETNAWKQLGSVPSDQRSIAVLWTDDHSGSIMTLLAWLTTRHPDWTGASLKVLVPDSPGEADRIRILLDEARIDCSIERTAEDLGAGLRALEAAHLAFVPLRLRQGHPLGPADTEVTELVGRLGATFLVHVAEDVELISEPDEGIVAQLAEARDRAAAATRRAADLDAEAARLLVEAEAMRMSADRSADGQTKSAEVAALEAVETAAIAARRQYADALTRAREATARVAELEGATRSIDAALWRSVSEADD
ncbi:MAG: amino acid permease [Acidimicrobiales bacterium]